MGKHVQSDEISLQPQVLIDPFERWHLDFVGPITLKSRKKIIYSCLYRLCYKVGRAKALHQDNEQSVADFLFK